MSEVFGAGYASAYDDLYADKNYEAECDLIESIIGSHDPTAKRILDIGCGTGTHSICLAKRGYAVTGVDRSRSMLEQAEQKANGLENPAALRFHHASVDSLDLGETFDVALMMFAVLGYQHTNDDVLGALRSARRHLRRDGILVFDVWYGPAVLRERPTERVKVAATERGETLRVTSGILDVPLHLCTVNYRLWRLQRDRLVERADEEHAVRYFFPLELELFLGVTGFELVRIGAFPDFARDPDETTWNVLVVARAVASV